MRWKVGVASKINVGNARPSRHGVTRCDRNWRYEQDIDDT